MADLSRLSFNQITADPYPTGAVIDALVAAGIGSIGLWRHKYVDGDVRRTAAMVRAAGLRVSSLCRGGFFPAATATERRARIDDNRRAIEEAAEIGTDVVVLVCGPAPDRDLDAARRMVEDGIAALLPDAAAAGIRLGIEPLHPVFCADRSVVVTLDQAIGMAGRFPPALVGVVVDVYHVWWDPRLYEGIAAATGRIVGFHTCDWLAGSQEPLMGRGLMGDGVIELNRIRAAMEATGYDGPIEVEIFNRDVWAMPLADIVSSVADRFNGAILAPRLTNGDAR